MMSSELFIHFNVLCGTSWNRTTFSGFSVLRIDHLCQSSNMPLSHTSFCLTLQSYDGRMHSFFVGDFFCI